MTQSILQHLTQSVNLSGFFVTDTSIDPEGLNLFLQRRMHVAQCSCCGRYCGIFYDSYNRCLRDLNWADRKIFLHIQQVRVDCPRCGIKAEKLPFAQYGSIMTSRFQNFIGSLCRYMTRADVAQAFDLSEDFVGQCEFSLLVSRYRKANGLKGLCKLRMDEIARRKGQSYLTVIVNADTDEVVEVVEGRSKDCLKPFFKRLGRAGCEQIQAVSIDMSCSYIAAIKHYCPKAKIVFDHFHVVKHLIDAINTIRISLKKQSPKTEQEQWRHSKRALGKNPENLTDKERQCLQWLLKEKSIIFTVYQLKVEFQQLWEYPTKRGAQIFLTRWLKKARNTGLEPIIEFCNLVENHREGIMNYYYYPLTNGPQEGLNNKLNVIRRKAYGYRNMYWFSLKIFQATDRNFSLWN